MVAVELLEGAIELGLGGAVAIVLPRLTLTPSASVVHPPPTRPPRRARSARRSPSTHSIAVELAVDQGREALEPARLDPGALDGRGDQRHRVEALRRLADRPGSARPARRAEQLAGAAVAAAGGEHRRRQVADPGEPGEGLEARAARQRVLDALAPDRRRGDPGGVQAVRLRGGRRQRGGVLGGARPSRRRRRRRLRSQISPARSKTSPSWARRSASGLARARAAVPDAASLACAGPPREATARERMRSSTYSLGQRPSGGTRPLLRSSTAVREPIRSPSAPTAAGSAAEGTARQTRSSPRARCRRRA